MQHVLSCRAIRPLQGQTFHAYSISLARAAEYSTKSGSSKTNTSSTAVKPGISSFRVLAHEPKSSRRPTPTPRRTKEPLPPPPEVKFSNLGNVLNYRWLEIKSLFSRFDESSVSQEPAASQQRGYRFLSRRWLVLSCLIALPLIAAAFTRRGDKDRIAKARKRIAEGVPVEAEVPKLQDWNLPGIFNFAAMSIPEGHLGNLTPEQEQKLKQFWTIVLKTFGVQDPAVQNSEAGSARPITPGTSGIARQPTTPAAPTSEKKRGLFHRKNKESVSDASPGSPGMSSDPDDKYGQTQELNQILAATSPQLLHDTFWSMVKKDHPDALLLRFLRARKWDIQRALAMLVSTMHWRANEMHVDDDIMLHGEGQAVIDSQSKDPAVAKEGEGFMHQLKLGKSYVHGIDKEGRPICFVRARLHKASDQTEKSLERYTVYVIETTRLALQAPVETATILFDMTHFSLSNMDYAPTKFMIKVFEANYPESLGSVLIHNAPWVFQGVWKIVRGWLDPVVAAKVHFTNDINDLSTYINRNQIPKELGGAEDWEFKYIMPDSKEDAKLADVQGRRRVEDERAGMEKEYEKVLFGWIAGDVSDAEAQKTKDNIAAQMARNYWQLDPYIRGRSIYDRTGMIRSDGSVDFYSGNTGSKPVDVAEQARLGGVPRMEASADDVD